MQSHIPLTLETSPWTDRSACQDHDPSLFFPAPGGNERQALAICETCEVTQECLAHALEAGEKFGIWGGTTQRQRRRLIQRQRWTKSA